MIKALISPTARRAAIFDENDQKWIYKSVGGDNWRSGGVDELDRIFKGTRDFEEVEAKDLNDVELQLQIKSDAARAIAMLDIALTAPDRDNAMWAAGVANELISRHATSAEVEKFLFAKLMPTNVEAGRLDDLREVGSSTSRLLRDLHKSQPRIRLLTSGFEKLVVRNRLTASQKAELFSALVQSGTVRQLTRLDKDREDIFQVVEGFRATNRKFGALSSVYQQIAEQLGRIAAKDFELSYADKDHLQAIKLLSNMFVILRFIPALISAIISSLTIRR
ncbi:hypothetical protein [Agrobacterium cavarae]|uniref:hypothetical protein n=1 Tax=Agrobacterium cavarae TaxID=2528239 RepID=UPI003EE483BA